MRTTAWFLFSLLTFIKLSGQEQPVWDFHTKNVVIKSICNTLQRNYVFPDKAQLMIKFLSQQNQDGAYESLTNPVEFTRQINKDLRSINHDKHLRIVYDVALDKDIIRFTSSKNGAENILKEDVIQDKRRNFHFKKVEILPPNIGYVQLNGFAVPSVHTSRTIHAAFQFVANTEALILDLRNNYGGNSAVGNEILSYFFSNKTKMGKGFNRIDNRWKDQFVQIDRAKTKGLLLAMPLYILTSERTFSAAEGLAYTLQSLKHATVIGNTTRGGAHLTRSFSLGEGFVAFVPYARSENIRTKTDWEGVGVIPDYAVKEDESLLFAQIDFLTKKLMNTSEKTEKNKVEYVLNLYKLKTNTKLGSFTTPQKLVGTYEYFEVSCSDNNELFFMDKKNFTKPIAMQLIAREKFQIGQEYQIEFTFDRDGQDCTGFKMFWDDGYEEFISKK